AVSDVIPAFEPEEIADPLPQYIEEEIETVGDIINELSQSIDEINGETGDLDDDFADLIQVSLEGFEEEFEKEFKPQIENRPESRDEAVQEVIKIAEDAIETIEEVIETVESAIEAIEEENEIDVERNIEDALEKFGDFRTGVTSLGEKPAEIPQVSFEPVSEPQPRPEPELSVPEIQPVSDVSMPVAEDDDFSGFVMSVPEVGIYNNRTPAGFAMFGRRVDVRDWADMLVKVCEILILKNPYTVAQFDKYHDLNPNENSYFSYNRVDIKDMPRKLSNGLWIELNRSNDDVVMLCKKLLELCGYPRSDIEIEFTD
ncbi:MAG: hypothetical protein FWG33_00580, partial [Oscillospiraceae bacterium]|nr:hypothetical protein [Oscillospiraceae bacterium]